VKVLVSGVGGLIGSSVAAWFSLRSYRVVGVENNTRSRLFGPGGDVSRRLRQLIMTCHQLRVEEWDLQDKERLVRLCREERFDAVVHCAAQPSHDYAGGQPDIDFGLNVVVTHNLLEAARMSRPDAPFVFLSTNKVYGEFPNTLSLVESELRFDLNDPRFPFGISESAPIDQIGKTIFGAHKAAADLMVQEYGRYYGMPTVCLRAGCITGARHAGVELHGFLNYLIRCAAAGAPYTVHGYQGKQVRDNLAADDLAELIGLIVVNPHAATVYNVGGGAARSLSVLEALKYADEWLGFAPRWTYSNEHRWGDHICYVSDLRRVQADYPKWAPTADLKTMFEQIAESLARP